MSRDESVLFARFHSHFARNLNAKRCRLAWTLHSAQHGNGVFLWTVAASFSLSFMLPSHCEVCLRSLLLPISIPPLSITFQPPVLLRRHTRSVYSPLCSLLDSNLSLCNWVSRLCGLFFSFSPLPFPFFLPAMSYFYPFFLVFGLWFVEIIPPSPTFTGKYVRCSRIRRERRRERERERDERSGIVIYLDREIEMVRHRCDRGQQ